MTRKVDIFDSTLRDGAQAEGISFSVEDKLKIVRTLDDLVSIISRQEIPDPIPRILSFLKECAM